MEKSVHVLLVDDDEDDREIFTWALKTVYPASVVDTAIDGLDALQKLKHWNYYVDIVFLDLNMPRIDGLEFLRQMRQVDKWRQLPVIVYSTSSNPQDMTRCLAEGATDYITKANDVATIKRDLLRAVEKYHPPHPEHEYRK